MHIDVLYFGVLKELFQTSQTQVELPGGANVGELVNLLQKTTSNQTSPWRSLAVAVNREYAGMDTMLQDGDEVALLPPVSGGSPCA
ncbi:molybdopterin synthase catalytic subunit/molybdopterin synthase sulfur carrier subunit [Granulicella rosea]|uniref:Molybdopterin synthase sulfur carrier subunit n=1 Tax=Granulicella rosea TaxID=474952 RepID=A0A239E3W1_9BACT|nr:molybdopterin converting factor subunit 1 [Granulicella rosea]SNS38652.1 molybdopterin synthase catalytic subunit/molybdopterin synthase sulfur carrier subunit [Granulicella rosea]